MFLTQQQDDVRSAIRLFTDTQRAFARCEANGIKIDVPYLERTIKETDERIITLQKELLATDVGRRWRELYPGPDFSLMARQQLARVLFSNAYRVDEDDKSFGYIGDEWTIKGQLQVSEESLEHLRDRPGCKITEFAQKYTQWMALNKMRTTNLKGIQDGLDKNGFLHPSFSLFSVISYRTSSSNPNFQNFPNHGALAGTVRSCFIPRSRFNHLAELDYSGAEVRVNASLNHDPMLVGSVTEGVDFHKSVAAKAYMLPESEVTKPLRQSVKGPFTFAAFYGSYWLKIAKGLWNGIEYGGLTLKDGTPLKDWLKQQGITGLGDPNNPVSGSYYAYIREVERWFWEDHFKVYGAWKKKNWEQYKRTGYVDLLSGFRCAGIFTRNMVNNLAAQGSAAHCLLWSFCRLTEELEKGYETKICGQIHDSILLDIPHGELDDVLRLANRIMTVELREHFKWLAVPMEIEADVAPEGKSWWEKKPYPIPE